MNLLRKIIWVPDEDVKEIKHESERALYLWAQTLSVVVALAVILVTGNDTMISRIEKHSIL